MMVECLIPRAMDQQLNFITRHDAEKIRQLILQGFLEKLGRS
ncbi:hypothetical protein SAMN05421545_0341 [Pontibacter lucknowensis]|uniref:Uncharacterized protein n=1 Tax=Pontibacter lucknowensis TaxID=1077936 RepID=A0A1N6THV1_9BACT|nr:hypothetical protein SAMN05421545_0341 [Pontibacter lucknowensis]